ncbi:hypothetical protein B0H67DRAFT_640458 [Lasiosphaeris hirsuta]|uniref:Uncharacterized protein n=1 Tax=Lasiosphaeris hirsuta TaxID=260670 RepID=A0AA40BDH6_9PEZI|nr:hypothetical protein B0H67DRAFT_640458 [Lasiosphaeris hirsuta]
MTSPNIDLLPSAEEFRMLYEDCFRTWAALHVGAGKEPRLPAQYLALKDAFRQHVFFPTNLKLEHFKKEYDSETGPAIANSTKVTLYYGHWQELQSSESTRGSHDWVHEDNHLDRLLTMSCSKLQGRLLLAGFFNPSLECNNSTPWIQGALGTIATLTQGQSLTRARMLMDRVPEVASLWIGATSMDAHYLLKQAHV